MVTKKTKKEIQSNRVFFVIISIIALVLGVSVWFLLHQAPQQTNGHIEQDIDLLEVYQRTLDGYETEYNYMFNGYVFMFDGTAWQTILERKNGQSILFALNYDPKNVSDIPIDAGVRMAIASKPVIALTTNEHTRGYTTVGMFQLGVVISPMYDFLSKQLDIGFTYNNSGAPLITCENATASYGVLYFTLGNTTAITQQGHCTIISGVTDQDISRASSALAMILTDIVEDKGVPADTLNYTATWMDDGILSVNVSLQKDTITHAVEGELTITLRNQTEPIYQWPLVITYDRYTQTGFIPLLLQYTGEPTTETQLDITFRQRSGGTLRG
ncbi:MAG: hypothetical protein ACMXYC_04700 [Candidatus Woesearchaeota archaeon]